MSWIIGILLVAVGAVIGFFVARYWLHEHSEEARLSEEVTHSKQQFAAYQQEVAEHLNTASALVEQLQDTQEKLKSYLSNSSDLLQREQTQPSLPFFAEDTIRQIRMANTTRSDRSRTDKENASEAPRDYSDKKQKLFTKD